MRNLAIGVCVVVLLMLVGCDQEPPEGLSSSELAKWIGEDITVHFRRDALGAAADLPVSPTVDTHNGVRMSMSGELQSVGPMGIAIQVATTPVIQYWIPREAILCIRR